MVRGRGNHPWLAAAEQGCSALPRDGAQRETGNREDAAGDTAWGATAALIAWDESSELLDMSVEEVEGLVKEGNHEAVLLLPAVIVKNKLKEKK